jgi:hypothetical protein
MSEGFPYLQVAEELKAAGGDAYTRLKDSDKPDLMARVMAVRAARAKLLRGTPAPAVDYNRM